MWHACSLIPLEGTPAVITPLCPCCALYGIRLTPGKKEKYGIMPIAGKKRKRDYRLQLHGYRGGIKIGNGLVGYIHCGGNPSFLRALRLPQWIYPRWCHYYHHITTFSSFSSFNGSKPKVLPSKLYIFIWNVAKFLLTPQSNDRRNYEGNDAQEKFLTPMVPPMQRTCFFQLFSDFFRDFF